MFVFFSFFLFFSLFILKKTRKKVFHVQKKMASLYHTETLEAFDSKMQDRFYYMENMVIAWWGIAISVCILGILIHINLENLAGEIIVIVGILFGVATLVAGMFWTFSPRQSQEKFVKTRLYFLYTKYALFTVILGVLVYTLVLMFEKNIRKSGTILRISDKQEEKTMS